MGSKGGNRINWPRKGASSQLVMNLQVATTAGASDDLSCN